MKKKKEKRQQTTKIKRQKDVREHYNKISISDGIGVIDIESTDVGLCEIYENIKFIQRDYFKNHDLKKQADVKSKSYIN